MDCQNILKARFRVLWSVSIAVTLLCCSLIIYHTITERGKMCSLHRGCSIPFIKKAAKLSSGNCKSVCTTPECTEIANTIISNMNASEDPCEDFYAFACGNYLDKHGQEDNYSIKVSLAEALYKILRDIIETSEETQIPNSASQKLKTVYNSCMDSKVDKLTDIRSLQSFLNHIGIENWPHLDSNFTFSNPTLDEVLGRLSSFEEAIFARFYANSYQPGGEDDPVNITVSTLQSNLRIAPENMKELVIDILRHAGMDDKDINSTWESFLDVEMQLLMLKRIAEESNSCEDEKSVVDECPDCNQENTQTKSNTEENDFDGGPYAGYIFLDCNGRNKDMLCKVLDSLVKQEGVSSRLSNERLLISCEETKYMEGLSNFLESHNHRILANYIALKVFINNMKYMHLSLRKKLLIFLKRPDMYFRSEKYALEMERSHFCVSWIAEYMKLPLGLMYVDEMWPPEALNNLNDIFYEYRNTTNEFWQAQESISEDARTSFLSAFENEPNDIKDFIDFFKNRTLVDSAYKQFHPKNDFLLNVLHHKKRDFISRNPYNEVEDMIKETDIFTVGAFSGRGVSLMFGIVLPPVFKHTYPKLFNIAEAGEIIGHEMGHTAFSVLRNSRNDTQTELYLNENNQCRAAQYNKFVVKKIGKNVRGNETRNENFSDNMSMQVSEAVAQELLRNMTENGFHLPGLDFSSEELFYIYYAQAWCAARSTQYEWDRFYYDQHSPPEFRVKGILQASERFSEVFKCSKTSYMNPQKKCLVFY